jgi:hypothetical protein
MPPPTSRTWSRRGRTPVVHVHGRPRQHPSIAALTCYKPGQRPRLIYRPAPTKQPGGRKDFTRNHYRDLLIAAHQQLSGPMVLVWDNLNTHVCAAMKKFIAEHNWLTVYQLPSYSPDLKAPGTARTGEYRLRRPRPPRTCDTPAPARHPALATPDRRLFHGTGLVLNPEPP